MTWHRLPDDVYRGPVVVARVHAPEPPQHAGAPGRVARFVECWALLDTGATHSVIDVAQVAARLRLPTHDHRHLALADRDAAPTPVHEVGVSFPDFPFPTRHVRVSALRLPGPFWMLVGMDLLDGTRLALEWRGRDRWLRWEPLTP